jgi:hypothetical protein
VFNVMRGVRNVNQPHQDTFLFAVVAIVVCMCVELNVMSPGQAAALDAISCVWHAQTD